MATRLPDSRLPAEPSSELQKARYRRILEVAVDLGSKHDFDHVQMQDVAVEAEVAIATLYRYFPSKVHLFVAVMRSRIDEMNKAQAFALPDRTPVEAAGDMLILISGQMYAQRRLSLSLIQSMIFAESLDNRDRDLVKDAFFDLVLRVAGWGKRPTEDQRRRAWLVTQCWFGVLMMVLNEVRSVDAAETDIRRACELLLTEST